MKPISHSFSCMGTRCTMVVPTLDDESNQLILLIQKELERIENLISWFSPKSELYRVNRHAHLDFFPVSVELFKLIEKTKEYHTRTSGYYDPTMRSLNQQPTLSTRKELRTYLGFDKVRLNKKSHSIFFENKHIDLDFGAIGKGYALDQAKKILGQFHVSDAFISFGNSSILALGNHPAGTGWPVGFQNNPSYPRRELPNRIVMHNQSLSISESYRINRNGELAIHDHILNPHTTTSVHHAQTVVVQSESALEAEVWSTALLSMPNHVQESFMQSFSDNMQTWISSPKEILNS